jgi:hypothetical protein
MKQLTNKQVRTALQGSIQKWTRIVNDPTVFEHGVQDCPLCELFKDRYEEDDWDECTGCPIAEFTGDECCDGSPYERWNFANSFDDWKSPDRWRANTPEKRKAAKAMLRFLEKLDKHYFVLGVNA